MVDSAGTFDPGSLLRNAMYSKMENEERVYSDIISKR